MISPEQFDNALRLIINYTSQLENRINNEKSSELYVNVQNKISLNTFKVLKSYYSSSHGIDLEWKDLKEMSLEKLKLIDLEKLRFYRGFGLKSENKLKKILESYINDINN
jgi:hypothetical protein